MAEEYGEVVWPTARETALEAINIFKAFALFLFNFIFG